MIDTCSTELVFTLQGDQNQLVANFGPFLPMQLSGTLQDMINIIADTEATVETAVEVSNNAIAASGQAVAAAANAAGSAAQAQTYANTATTQASNAANSATASANSASSAATQAGNAATSATAAAVSAGAASTSATNAEGSATASSNSAAQSAASATASANSATSATTQATNAANSAADAATSAGTAQTYRDAANSAKTGAETARDAAAGSASGALGSKNAAATSASNAATSETNAANSAASAQTQANRINTPTLTPFTDYGKTIKVNAMGTGYEFGPKMPSTFLSDAAKALVVNAQGDGFTPSITLPALAGADAGSTLVVNQTGTGLSASPMGMYKNKIINGNFDLWQRGSGPYTGASTYTADRWAFEVGTGTSVSLQRNAFSAGASPFTVPADYWMGVQTALVGTADGYTCVRQRIEGVDVLRGTVTVSFWASGIAGNKVAVNIKQGFGTGGSANVFVGAQQITLAAVWTKYTLTFTLPSIGGKTVGAGNHLELQFWTNAGSSYSAYTGGLGLQSGIVNFGQIQLESGSSPTLFERLALSEVQRLCYRYYYLFGYSSFIGAGTCMSAGLAYCQLHIPVPMRAFPALLFFGNPSLYQASAVSSITNITSLYYGGGVDLALGATGSGFIGGQSCAIFTGTGTFSISAEL